MKKTTVAIDDKLLFSLKLLALKKGTTLIRVFDEVLRIGSREVALKMKQDNEKFDDNLPTKID